MPLMTPGCRPPSTLVGRAWLRRRPGADGPLRDVQKSPDGAAGQRSPLRRTLRPPRRPGAPAAGSYEVRPLPTQTIAHVKLGTEPREVPAGPTVVSALKILLGVPRTTN